MALTNMSVASFKDATKSSSFKFLRNPKTGKVFASSDNGNSYKVEQEIDFTKPIVILVEDGDLNKACFINERESTAELLHTL